jgi:hypothetical protein
MPAHNSDRLPRDPDLPMRFAQTDGSWYENYWLTESPPPRPRLTVARSLPKIVSWLRLAKHVLDGEELVDVTAG